MNPKKYIHPARPSILLHGATNHQLYLFFQLKQRFFSVICVILGTVNNLGKKEKDNLPKQQTIGKDIWVFPKIMVPPNHPLKNWVWNHYFYHPFWGPLPTPPLFLVQHPYLEHGFVMVLDKPFLSCRANPAKRTRRGPKAWISSLKRPSW